MVTGKITGMLEKFEQQLDAIVDRAERQSDMQVLLLAVQADLASLQAEHARTKHRVELLTRVILALVGGFITLAGGSSAAVTDALKSVLGG